jgi:hypothetical protein
MNDVERWSQRIARRILPAEADSAARVGAEYASGGRKRRDLFARYETQPGGFGPGGAVAQLPLILQSLAQARDALSLLLSSQYLSNILAAASLLVALAERSADRARTGERSRDAVRQQTAGSVEGSSPAAGVPAPTSLAQTVGPEHGELLNERNAVEQAFKSLSRRLQSAGFTAARADQIAGELLREFLADAGSAAEADRFLAALSARRYSTWGRRLLRLYRRARR